MPNETIITPSVTDVVTIDGLEELWAETLGDPRICIAILDGPVDKSHPSLKDADLTQLETLVSRSHVTGAISLADGQTLSQVR